jgi:geranylgeranyl diphosphate synthase type II
MSFACALELVHTYSLVHDDLPAMDDDDVRRGRPTSHKVFGDAVAILVGDALLTEAFGVMARAKNVSAARIVAAVDELARAAGEAGMVGGQARDLAAEGSKPTLAKVRGSMRSRPLLRASVRIGRS